MARLPDSGTRRFPWGYLPFALLPGALMIAMFVVGASLGPSEAMGPCMLLGLLIGPAGLLAIGIGVIRLSKGDGQKFPALRWLVWLPASVSVAVLVLG